MSPPSPVTKMLIVHAPNVHSGGGGVLLRSILDDMPPDVRGTLVSDARFEGRVPPGWRHQAIAPRLLPRLEAELRLRALARDADRVLCFGNLPPLFRLDCPVSVFVHNRNLMPGADLSGYSPRVRARHLVEVAWLRHRRSTADEFIVQTRSMSTLMRSVVDGDTPVVVRPFLPSIAPATSQRPRRYDFIYVAAGEPHKNHRQLIAAWETLARESVRPRLLLTVDPTTYPELAAWMAQRRTASGLAIDNLEKASRERVIDAYRESGALIFPSLSESFGLPLVEADAIGLPVLASDSDVVRDVVTPMETFDPRSAESIASAVRRYLARPSERARASDRKMASPREWIRAVVEAT